VIELIELSMTEAPCCESVFVNLQHVVCFGEYFHGPGTMVQCVAAQFVVNETPEEILAMIEKAAKDSDPIRKFFKSSPSDYA